METEYQKTVYSMYHDMGRPCKGDMTCRAVYRIAKRYVAGPVLDVGCGSGSLMEYLQVKGHTVTGVDLYKSHPQAFVADATKLPFEADSFRTVFMTDVIEHLSPQQAQQAVSEARRVLNTQGHIIVVTDNEENLAVKTAVCPKCGEVFHRTGHLQSFSAAKLAALLTKTGFSDCKAFVRALEIDRKIPVFGRFLTGWPVTTLVKWMGFTNSLIVIARK